MLASFNNKQVEYKLVEPRSFRWGVVNPDYEQVWNPEDFVNYQKVSRPTRNGVPYHIAKGLPATARFTPTLGGKDIVYFTREFQEFIFNLNHQRARQTEAESKADFASLFRDNVMMCDFGGTWSRADWINGTNLEAGDIALKPMVCGGTLLKIVGEYGRYYLVEGGTNRNFEQYISNPYLLFPPVLSVRDWIPNEKGNDYIEKREWFAEPFDDFNGNTLLPVLGSIPDARSSTGYVSAIEKNRVRILAAGSKVPNPFVLRSGKVLQNYYETFVV